MGKVLIIGVAVVLLLWLLFGSGRRAARAKTRRTAAQGRDGTESMVACAHCGVHLPRSEALADRGLHYCSAAHRDLAPPAA